MPEPRQVMSIHLSPEQTGRLLDWARGGISVELDDDCEPSGYTLEVTVTPGKKWVEAVGYGRIDLGDVKVKLVDVDEA